MREIVFIPRTTILCNCYGRGIGDIATLELSTKIPCGQDLTKEDHPLRKRPGPTIGQLQTGQEKCCVHFPLYRIYIFCLFYFFIHSLIHLVNHLLPNALLGASVSLLSICSLGIIKKKKSTNKPKILKWYEFENKYRNCRISWHIQTKET